MTQSVAHLSETLQRLKTQIFNSRTKQRGKTNPNGLLGVCCIINSNMIKKETTEGKIVKGCNVQHATSEK